SRAARNPPARPGGAASRSGGGGPWPDAQCGRGAHDAPAPAFRTPIRGGLTMDWNDIRQRWREDVPLARLASIDELQRADARLATAVRRRDRMETVAAVLVALLFLVGCIVAAIQGLWIELVFGLVVLAWAAWLPFAFRRARREVPAADPRMPPVAYLSRQRDAALVQARLLERVWLWYLTPPAVGIFGLTLAIEGITAGSVTYLAS